MLLLGGDIGGTNSRFLCARVTDHQIQPVAEASYPSQEFTTFDQVLDDFITRHQLGQSIQSACLAVAGPVRAGSVKVTNLPWHINEKGLAQILNTARVSLMNDFTGVTYGIDMLSGHDTVVLQQGETKLPPDSHPSAAVIGAGTGLGVSHRAWIDHHYQAFPSEAGHTGFAPQNEQQRQLLAWLQSSSPYVSNEMILSGRGLAAIYTFMHEVAGLSETATTREAMQHSDPARVITEHADKYHDELCQKTINCFIDIYGATAGNAALYYYPVEEVYIAGGIAMKLKRYMQTPRFIEAFRHKGIMTDSMNGITVKLILQDKVGLYGALSRAQQMLD